MWSESSVSGGSGAVQMVWRCFFFQAEDGIRDLTVTGVQTCALPISDREAVVLVSGNLGLIYLLLGDGRLTLERIIEAHPRLVAELSTHPGIGFVMVRSQALGPLVIGAGGQRRLLDDVVEGNDPLAGF